MQAVEEKTQQTQPDQGAAAFRPPKKRKKWPKRVAVLAVAAAAVYWFWPGRGGSGEDTLTYTPAQAVRRDLAVEVTGSGAVAPIDSYRVGALVTGEILAADFNVGDWVEKGQVLYEVDPGDAQTALRQAELSLRQAQMSSSEAAEGLSPAAGVSGVVQKVYVSRGDLVSPGTAIADVADTSVMTLTLPFQSADAAGIRAGQSAQVTLAGTMEVLPGTVESVSSADLVGNGGALVRQVKLRVNNPGALTEDTSATAVVGNAACADSGTFQANARQTVVAQGSGEVSAVHVTAGSRVSAGTVLATLGGSAAQSTAENAAIALENAQLNLERARKALDSYEITAPISGTVVEKNFKAGDKIETESLSAAGGSLATIFDLESLKLQMAVNELDIGQVEPGQTVTLTADALPGQSFTGVVDTVSINGTTTGGFTTYPVTILVQDYGQLKPGMNVSARVQCQTAENALCVPVSAVSRGSTVLVAQEGALAADGVTVADPTKIVSRTVTLGVSDDQWVQITSGLEEGETVLIEGGDLSDGGTDAIPADASGVTASTTGG